METKNVGGKTAKKTQKQWGIDEYVNWDNSLRINIYENKFKDIQK